MNVQNISTLGEILDTSKQTRYSFPKEKQYYPCSTSGKVASPGSQNSETRQRKKQRELSDLLYMNLTDSIRSGVSPMITDQRTFSIRSLSTGMVSSPTSPIPIPPGRSEEWKISMVSSDSIFLVESILRVFRTNRSMLYKRSSTIVRENASDGSLRTNTMQR